MEKRRSRTSLRKRFIFGMAVMLIPLVGLAYGAYSSLQTALKALEEVITVTIAQLEPIQDLQLYVKEARRRVDRFLIDGPEAGHEQRFGHIASRVNALMEKHTRAAGFDGARRLKLLQAKRDWQEAEKAAAAIFRSGRPNDLKALRPLLARLDASVAATVDRLNDIQMDTMSSVRQKKVVARSVHELALLKIVGIFFLGLCVAGLEGLLLAQSVVHPLRELERGVMRFGDGDLTHRVALETRDEIEQLATAFNTMAAKLKQTQEMLESLSIHDGLTGLYNHREFHRWLEREVARYHRYRRPLSLLMLDIDHFKKVNDTYGHQAGDEVLRALAQLLRHGVRTVDKVGRYGGEEFGVLLPETSAERAVIVATHLRQRVEGLEITLPQGQTLHITISVGVATFDVDAKSEQELVAAADRALYAAKRGGGAKDGH